LAEETAQAAKSAAAAAADVAKASQEMLASKGEGGFNGNLICMV
jgi:peroxin-14